MRKVSKRQIFVCIIYIFFCIVDLCIIPGNIRLLRTTQTQYDLTQYICLWLCCIGGLLHIFYTAVCEFLNKVYCKRENGNLFFIAAVFELSVVGLRLKETVKGESIVYAAFIYLLPLFTAAGMWLGRSFAGKYKRRVSLINFVYTAVCAVCMTVLCAAVLKNKTYVDQYGEPNGVGLYILIFMLFASVLYGRFSDYEYLLENVVYAVTVNYLLYIPFGVCNHLSQYMKYEDYWHLPSMQQHFFAMFVYNISELLPYFTGVAAAGVLMGCFLRIMKFGGSEESQKPSKEKVVSGLTFALRVILGTVAVCCVFALLVKYQYWFYRTYTVWDIIDLEESEIESITVHGGRYGWFFKQVNMDDEWETGEKIIDVLKQQRGARTAIGVKAYEWDVAVEVLLYGRGRTNTRLIYLENGVILVKEEKANAYDDKQYYIVNVPFYYKTEKNTYKESFEEIFPNN